MDGGGISPYRMSQLVKLSSKLTDTMLSNVWQLSYQEIDVVMDILHAAVEGSRNAKETIKQNGLPADK